MKDYVGIIASDRSYQPGLSAFLTSFRIHHEGMGIKLIVCDYDLEPEFIDHHDGDDIEWVKVNSIHGKTWATKIERFRIASELTDKIVAVFDSDMFVCGSLLNYWKMAEGGLIIGGSNGSNIRFGPDWNEKYKMEVDACWNTKTLTSVPTFMDVSKHGKVWSEIYRHKKETNAGGDFPLLNIFLRKLNKLDKVIPFPSEIFTGVHHFMLKCDTRIINKAGALLTSNGLELKVVHGRYWQGDWYTNLTKNMPKYLARLGIHSSKSKEYQGVLQSQQLLKDEFDKYCDWPYTWSVKPATEANVQEEFDKYFVEPVAMEEQNQALVEKNLELNKRIDDLKREVKVLQHDVKVADQPQKFDE